MNISPEQNRNNYSNVNPISFNPTTHTTFESMRNNNITYSNITPIGLSKLSNIDPAPLANTNILNVPQNNLHIENNINNKVNNDVVSNIIQDNNNKLYIRNIIKVLNSNTSNVMQDNNQNKLYAVDIGKVQNSEIPKVVQNSGVLQRKSYAEDIKSNEVKNNEPLKNANSNVLQSKSYAENIKNNEVKDNELSKNVNSTENKKDNRITSAFQTCKTSEELEETKEKLLKKYGNDILKKKEIEEAKKERFEDLFCEHYDKLSKEYNNSNSKLDTNKAYKIISNFAFNKTLQILYSCEENNIKQLITLQNAVNNIVKEIEDKKIVIERLTKENIDKFFQVINKLTKNQLHNVSMLYNQINLRNSNQTMNKINQTLDYTELFYLLSDHSKVIPNPLFASFITPEKELTYAYINNYLTSGIDNTEEYTKKFANDKENILEICIKNYTNRMDKILNNNNNLYINFYKMFKDFNLNIFINQLNVLNQEKEWTKFINKLSNEKYLESFNILVNTIVKLYKEPVK